MFHPVYQHNSQHQALADRRRNLLGWVFSPFRGDAVLVASPDSAV
ncbi:MAG: hypothetical protein C4516_05305 [Oxalobacter sp.]|nr:MAG: hypothetical protein C4516_05305 [Oxalobacter sp.]